MSDPAALKYQQGTVIITGASKGIGRQIALEFAARTRHKLVLISRNRELLEETKIKCLDLGCPKVDSHSVDLANQAEIQQFAFDVDIEFLSGIINNAGMYAPKNLKETTQEDIEKNLSVNLYSSYLLNDAFLPKLKDQGRGFLFHVGSLAAYTGLERAVGYTISKHALLGYVRSLRKDVMDQNIAVSVIHPGNTWSTSWEGSGVDPKRLINAQDIARLFVTMAEMSPQSVVEEIVINPQEGNLG